MSLFAHRGRVEVSSGDSELDSIAASIADSADELIEELARMTLAGNYAGAPSAYETSQLLQGRGMARRVREVIHPRPGLGSPRQPTCASLASSSTPSYPARARANTKGGSSLSPGAPCDVEEAENDARALDKMYRRLARQYRAERHSVGRTSSARKDAGSGKRGDSETKGDSTCPPLSIDTAPARLTRRKLDELVGLRLSALSKVQLARQVEKYERRKEREEEALKQPKRVRVSAEAVKRGSRLFLEAQERANNVRRIQEKQARQKAAQEKKECTFHPSVSKYAAQLAAGGAYYSLESRLEDQAAHDEKRLRLRLERVVELEKECTFKPTLSPGTEELMPILRRRRQSRYLRRFVRTSDGDERSRGSRRGGVSSSRHEPFEAGERLYRDGGERLLRQQVRLLRATTKEQRHVVGGGLRLSHADAQQLTDRFTAWAAARAANREGLRLALEQQTCETAQNAAKRGAWTRHADGFQRRGSSSNFNGSESAPRLAKLAGSGWGDSEPSAPGALSPPPPLSTGHFYAPSKESPRDCAAANQPEASRKPSNTARSAHSPSDADFVATAANGLRSLKSPSAPATGPALDLSVDKELLRIHLGALFYKYAVFPTATAVCLAQVKQQVRCYYPEDSSIVSALASSFSSEQQLITKTDFMAALARYVAQYGIQPWCLPHRSVPSAPAALPYGSKTFHTSAAAAVTSNDLVSPSDPSEMMNDDAVVSTPSWTGTRTSSGVQGPPNEAECLLVTPTTIRTSEGTSEEKPLRTRIYSFPPHSDDSQPTSPPVTVTPSHGEKASMETAPTAALRCTSADRSKETPYAGSRSRGLSKHTRPAKTPTVTAERVRGYEDYVQRQRRAIDRMRAASDAGQTKAEEVCAFRPTLTPRSVMLSNRNLEKRMAYARELHLRHHNLQLLHNAVLAERSGKGGSSGAAGSQEGAEACGTLASTQTPPPTPFRKHSSASLSGTSSGSYLSPSIEVSSLSCSTPLQESGSATSKPTATLSPPPPQLVAGDAGMARAIAVLEQLLSGVAGKDCSTQAARAVVRTPPLCPSVQKDVLRAAHGAEMTPKDVCDATQTVATAPLSQFFVSKPAQAILSAKEEHFAFRHAAMTSRQAD